MSNNTFDPLKGATLGRHIYLNGFMDAVNLVLEAAKSGNIGIVDDLVKQIKAETDLQKEAVKSL